MLQHLLNMLPKLCCTNRWPDYLIQICLNISGLTSVLLKILLLCPTLSKSRTILNIDAVLSVHVKISYLWNNTPHSSLNINGFTVYDTIILLLAACTILRICPSPRVHSSRVIWSFCHIIEELSLYSRGVWACHSVTITLCPSPSNFCMERAVEMS